MPPAGRAAEHELIARYLRPLASADALSLADDVGLLAGRAVTKDLIVCGVHYRADDPLDTVAQKAVRVNVSDIVAKGCRPEAALLGCVWPEDAGEGAVSRFAVGLSRDLTGYGLGLLGGDTTRAPGLEGPMISVTMTGLPFGTAIVHRGGARPGDTLLVGGPIGDAGLALDLFGGDRRLAPFAEALTEAYRRPAPPWHAAQAIAAHARAGLDVSDGLLIDAGRLAEASGLRAEIAEDAIPLSPAGRAYRAGGGRTARLAAAGDDYVPLVAVPPDRVTVFLRETAMAGTTFTRVGACVPGSGVALLDAMGRNVTPARLGYSH